MDLIVIKCPICGAYNREKESVTQKMPCQHCGLYFMFDEALFTRQPCGRCDTPVYLTESSSQNDLTDCPVCNPNNKGISISIDQGNSLYVPRPVTTASLIRECLKNKSSGATSWEVYWYCKKHGAYFDNPDINEQRKSVSGQLSKMQERGEVYLIDDWWFIH
jgi:DNA-directed RNA polymerase subunit RPC12/RpoP